MNPLPVSAEPLDGSFERDARVALRAAISSPTFSCLGARAALRAGSCRVGTYARLDDAASTRELARDLLVFDRTRRREAASPFASFVAIFAAGGGDDSLAFERALWAQLGRLHDGDGVPWDPRVSDDPDAADFSFSFGGSAYFVVGLEPHASRSARRFPYAAMAFNAHDQFERLRADGRYAGLRDAIRSRELAADGSLNPNLAEHGAASEARQYAGRAVGEDWRCPFRP